jgi:hypothetical protein
MTQHPFPPHTHTLQRPVSIKNVKKNDNIFLSGENSEKITKYRIVTYDGWWRFLLHIHGLKEKDNINTWHEVSLVYNDDIMFPISTTNSQIPF